MKSNNTPSGFAADGRIQNVLLTAQAHALITAANGLANMALSPDDALSLALEMFQHPPTEAIAGGDIATRLDPQRLLLLTIGVSRISGRSIDRLTQRIFDAHPGIPNRFDAGAIVSLRALSSFDSVMVHREESQNALLIPEFVVEDVARGTAFYAIQSARCTRGTIALHLGGTRRFPKVDVEWVVGTNNTDASTELEKLAKALADSWVTELELGEWVIYEGRCAEWRRLASCAASQLPQ